MTDQTTERSVTHSTFAIERVYDAPPARLFAAFADPAVKARWFGPPEDWTGPETVFEFAVGGREHHESELDGQVHTFQGRYWDIVPDQRIVFTYDMLIDGTRISVSLATVQLVPDGGGTKMVFTEHGAYLDGHDGAVGREHGSGELLDALEAELKRQTGGGAA